MAQVTITGTIKVVGKTQDVSASFKKRELVVTEPGGQRPSHIPIEFTQDRTSLLDSFSAGEEVTVTCYGTRRAARPCGCAQRRRGRPAFLARHDPLPNGHLGHTSTFPYRSRESGY
jgi:Domain of unknown function (DUF3127)